MGLWELLDFPNASEEQPEVSNAVRALAVRDDAVVEESAPWVPLPGTLVLNTAS